MEYLVLALFFAILCLDVKEWFQFNLAQPLVSSFFVGLISGELETAMYFGTIVQLLWLGNLPIGASKVPEGEMASVVGAILFMHFNNTLFDFGNFLLFICVIYTIILSFIGSQMNTLVFKFNGLLLNKALFNAEQNTQAKTGRFLFFALFSKFVANAIFIYATTLAGILLISHIGPYLNTEWNEYWQYAELASIGAGIGMTLGVYKRNTLKQIFLVSGLAGIILYSFI